MKYLMIALFSLLAFGCNLNGNSATKMKTSETGYKIDGFNRPIKTICLRNVEYYLLTTNYKGMLTPAFKPDGRLFTCTPK